MSIYKSAIFVDLAGFEPTDGTDSASSLFINSTLLTLQNVLKAIVSKSVQIPFRESILTKILRPYLLTQCKIFILGTVALQTFTTRNDHTTLKFVSSLTGKRRHHRI